MLTSLPSEEPAETDIAIIGMSGRFPGADTPDQLWSNVLNGVESVTFFSEDEMLKSGVGSDLLRDPDYVNASPVLNDAARFDARFFGYSPREALIMDPQQRLFLECSWEALERAGYDADRYEGPIGVFAGAAMNTYILQLAVRNKFFANYLPTLITNDKDFLATRVSYKMNLTGPSMTIQTACSSSLVSVHSACQSLLSEECDMALAGGVSIRVPQRVGYLYEEGSVFSPDGHCRPFDAGAQGTIFGSGAGVVVLKRLTDAIADKDYVWAVIKGSAINNDGGDKSDFTAPSVRQQARAISEAHSVAGVDPDTISYVEAHGTGTYLGDPIEVAALSMAFREGTSKKQFCAIGSLKSNIGHLDAAAGVAGLIKTAYALKNRRIPPTINYERPNPEINFEDSPFWVADAAQDWKRSNGPLRAGVQSLGMGGTNAHVILEEAPSTAPVLHSEKQRMFFVSGKTPEACVQASANLAEAIEASADIELSDIAYTLSQGRKAFPFRNSVVASNRDDLARAFRSDFAPTQCDDGEPHHGFMFSGQGTQYVNMGRGLYQSETVYQTELDRCFEAFGKYLDSDLNKIVFPNDGDIEDAARLLKETQYTQPALFSIEYALARLWMSYGVEPQWMIGHSIGEYAAACISGVFSFDAAVEIVAARGRLMQSCEPGSMLAVRAAAKDIEDLLNDELCVSVINTPASCVVSGSDAAVDELASQLESCNKKSTRLQTSHAFHSPTMVPILDSFRDVVAKHALNEPSVPFISNVTGTWITSQQATNPQYWADHIGQPVRFADGVGELLQSEENAFIEVGPGNSLSTFLRQHPTARSDTTVVSSIGHPTDETDDYAYILSNVGQLWSAGADISADVVVGDADAGRVPLPTYPFEHKSYWMSDLDEQPVTESEAFDLKALTARLKRTGNFTAHQLECLPELFDAIAGAETTRSANARPLQAEDPEDWMYDLVWEPQSGSKRIAPNNGLGSWLIYCDEAGVADTCAAMLEERGDSYIRVRKGDAYRALGMGTFELDPYSADDYSNLLRDIMLKQDQPLRGILHFWSLDVPSADTLPALKADTGGDAILASASLAYLVRALAEQNDSSYIGIFTSAAVPARPGRSLPGLNQAPVWGIGQAVAAEHPDWRVRLIDLPHQPSSEELQTAIVELGSDSDEEQVAFRKGVRYVPRLRRHREILSETAAKAPIGKFTISANATYVVTGGLGYLGLRFAHWLVARGARRLVLIGRSGLSDEATNAVQVMESKGTTVLCPSVDVSDADALKVALEQCRSKEAPLRGIVHIAGVFGNTPVKELTAEELRRVLWPKMQGGRNLHQLTKNETLDFFISFSSVGAVCGGRGQGHYDGANRFLDSQAHHRRSENLPALSVNWGRFPKGSMGGDDLHDVLDQIGLGDLEPNAAFDILDRLSSTCQATVARMNWHAFKSVIEARKPKLLLERLSDIEATNSDRDTSSEHHTDAAGENELQAYLLNQVGEALGYELDQIDTGASLVTLGLDSLAAVALRNRIAIDCGTDVPMVKLVGGISIQELSTFLEENSELQESAGTTQVGSTLPLRTRPETFGASRSAGRDEEVVSSSPSKMTNIDEQELYLRQQVSEALGYEMHEIDVTASLIVLGLDSLGAVALRNRIVTDNGVDVPMAKLVGGLSIRELSAFLAESTQNQKYAEGAQSIEVAPVRFVEGEL